MKTCIAVLCALALLVMANANPQPDNVKGSGDEIVDPDYELQSPVDEDNLIPVSTLNTTNSDKVSGTSATTVGLTTIEENDKVSETTVGASETTMAGTTKQHETTVGSTTVEANDGTTKVSETTVEESETTVAGSTNGSDETTVGSTTVEANDDTTKVSETTVEESETTVAGSTNGSDETTVDLTTVVNDHAEHRGLAEDMEVTTPQVNSTTTSSSSTTAGMIFDLSFNIDTNSYFSRFTCHSWGNHVRSVILKLSNKTFTKTSNTHFVAVCYKVVKILLFHYSTGISGIYCEDARATQYYFQLIKRMVE